MPCVVIHEQHDASSPMTSGSGSNSSSSRARRMASADKFGRVSESPEDAE